jgi:hypothetical protein
MTFPLSDVGTIYATWTDPTGVEWPLTDKTPDRGYHTTRGIAGWGAMPYEIVTDPQARGGETVRHVRQLPARLTWPLNIWGDTHLEFVDRYRALRRAIMMTVHRGQPGRLTVMRSDGSGRFIEAFYEDGWGGESGENWLFANPVVTFYCPDGAWKDIERVVETRTFGTAGTLVSFLAPFPTFSAGQSGGSPTLTNPGELVAWPEWVITGPASGITGTNVTTGKSFSLVYDLAAGESITVTTDRPTVRGPAGQNLVNALNWPTAYLWGLEPGDNTVEFSIGGSGIGTTIEISFYPRYEGA